MVSSYTAFEADWPHQSFAVTEGVRTVNEGVRSLCITSPTGGGKSRVIQRLCEHFAANGMKTVVMSNRKLLTNQLLKGLHSSGVRVGCRASEFESWTDMDATVQVISGPTENARVFEKRRTRGANIELHRADAILVDECHMQTGQTAKQIIDEYRDKFSALAIGITATPIGVSHIYDELIVAGNNSELRKCGALVAAKCYEPAVIDLPKVRRSKTGLFSQKELDTATKAIWSQHIVGHVWDHWNKLNPDGRPSLGMAPGVAEARGLALAFWRQGINAAHIDAKGIFINGEWKSTTEQQDRDEVFAMSKDGRCPMIWNRFVLREAIDLPWLFMLSLATPIASLTSFLQTIGRILRASPGKDCAVIADHCGAIRMHGSPNADRDQQWRQYFRESDCDKITKDRFYRMTDPNNREPEPITCPNCQMIRKTGAQCPGCKHEHPQSVRMVIQESGKLKQVKGDVYPKRRVQQKANTEKIWIQTYMRMRNAKNSKTFRQALALFKRENYYYPPDNMPLMPINPNDLSRKIKDVPYAELHPRKESYEPVASTGPARDGEHQAKTERRLF